jgi:competence protein CoiA
MLTAKACSTGEQVIANHTTKSDGPFLCPECENEVVLKVGTVRLNHFAHKSTTNCEYGKGETEAHRKCKMAIYEALLKEPNVKKAALERSLKTCRPDVSAYINGVPVAIEVQISTLTMDKIIQRTEEYARKGIYVLWLLQWTPYLDSSRYAPRLWEKWIHAAYFGNAYYWIEGLQVVNYHFDPYLKHVSGRNWHLKNGEEKTVRGHSKRSKRYRSPVRGNVLNLTKDFIPNERNSWEGNGFKIPPAKLFIEKTADLRRSVQVPISNTLLPAAFSFVLALQSSHLIVTTIILIVLDRHSDLRKLRQVTVLFEQEVPNSSTTYSHRKHLLSRFSKGLKNSWKNSTRHENSLNKFS